MKPVPLLLAAAFSALVAGLSASDQRAVPDAHSGSKKAGITNPIDDLGNKLGASKVRLTYDPRWGYLRSLLERLSISPSSQCLVFSKTSTQADHTSPRTPRAIYFNDNAYVAWAQNDGLIDVAAQDPIHGSIFYTLPQTPSERPFFTRRDECLNCHQGRQTNHVPGLFVRSLYVAPDGEALAKNLWFTNGHSSPLAHRWGGWYVTGGDDRLVHMGNKVFPANTVNVPANRWIGTDLLGSANSFDPSKYLAPTSDIVALLVLEHQMRMQNLLTAAQFRIRELQSSGNRHLERGAVEAKRLEPILDPLLEYMLFIDEASLPTQILDDSEFKNEFQRLGPFDGRGRSLRQFDLRRRIFKFPCSYMIYSESFDRLPQMAKDFLWQKLTGILSGQDKSHRYEPLSDDDKRALLQILYETKPEFKRWLDRHGCLKALQMAHDPALEPQKRAKVR